MTVQELEKHRLYKLCTIREQTFLLSYLTTRGDMAKAILIGWPNCKSVPAMAKKLQNNETVAVVLAMIDGEEMPTKESLTRLLWHTINTTKNPSIIIKGAEQIAELEGYNDDPEDSRSLKIQKARELDNGN